VQVAGTRIVLNVRLAVDRRSGRAAAEGSRFGMAVQSGRLLAFRHNSATASSFVVASFAAISTFVDASSSAIALSSCYP